MVKILIAELDRNKIKDFRNKDKEVIKSLLENTLVSATFNIRLLSTVRSSI
jgi:hypothetical protein